MEMTSLEIKTDEKQPFIVDSRDESMQSVIFRTKKETFEQEQYYDELKIKLKLQLQLEINNDPLIKSYLIDKKVMLAQKISSIIGRKEQNTAKDVALTHKALFKVIQDDPTLLSTYLPTYMEIESIVAKNMLNVLTSIRKSATVKNMKPEHALKKSQKYQNDVVTTIAIDKHRAISDHVEDFKNYKTKLIDAMSEIDNLSIRSNWVKFWKILAIDL